MEEGCHDCMAMSSSKTNLQEIVGKEITILRYLQNYIVQMADV